jgi:hypothetical protein
VASKTTDLIALVVATVVSIACGLLAIVWHEGDAALLLGLLTGAVLGFVFPRGAWRLALILAAWVPVALVLRSPLVPSSALPWCSATSSNTKALAWTLALAPVLAVYAGVVVDWILSQTVRWLSFTGWPFLDVIRPSLRIAAIGLALLFILVSAAMLAQPLHPYGLGNSYCWDEYCFAVMSVRRAKTIDKGSHSVRAHGMFYIVTADMEAPWWGRFNWSNDAVYAIDYDGTDYTYSRPGQSALDRTQHSNRSRCHKILGAGETETIVFDLPANVVQPRLLVRDTLGFEGFLGAMRLRLYYVKPAFNLRYD